MGIATVAVYSEADKAALHVEVADEAWPIGPAPARESYLSIDKILDIARRSGAQAIHPGYGFLAENADFAERCSQAGVIFVGPPPNAMRLMGSKASAKSLMERVGVPILPGYHGAATDEAAMSAAAQNIGFPLLVKASAGGGGRGMRVVRRMSELAAALESAAREAVGSFGDGRLLLEKYLLRPRHIEIQIFADAYGEVDTFIERDCSIQRRHQKILEETPACGLSENMRREMRAAATTAALAAGYVGAGTIEFLCQDDAYYFLEMNTRLQVEHPVTEMVTGLDLVEWQFRVACGEPLPVREETLVMRGCAIEARICAEDPARDFLPSIGVIEHFRKPGESATVRVDTGVRRGDRVTQHYDSLIAKLVVYDGTRGDAIQRLQEALDSTELVGVATNLDFLRALARDPRFLDGSYDTGFIEAAGDELTVTHTSPQDDMIFILAAATAMWIADLRERDNRAAREIGDPWSPWSQCDAWRVHGRGYFGLRFSLDGEIHCARVLPHSDDDFQLDAFSQSVIVVAIRDGDRTNVRVDGVKRELGIVRRDDGCVVILAGRDHHLHLIDPLLPAPNETAAERSLSTPFPARVTRVLVDAGESVRKGAPLVVLEAMKMEVTLTAPRDGMVAGVHCVEGETAREGAELIELVDEAPT